MRDTKQQSPGLNITADILFARPQDENVNIDERDLVELFPYGLSLSNDASRPFMILKDKTGDMVLPVPVNQLEAGVTLTQSGAHAVRPHAFSVRLLESLDIRLERCLFVEIKGVHQYVRVYMSGHPRYHSLKFRADEVMSLCIELKTPLFATKNFINRSKVMSAEIAGLARQAAGNPQLLVKPPGYLM